MIRPFLQVEYRGRSSGEATLRRLLGPGLRQAPSVSKFARQRQGNAHQRPGRARAGRGPSGIGEPSRRAPEQCERLLGSICGTDTSRDCLSQSLANDANVARAPVLFKFGQCDNSRLCQLGPQSFDRGVHGELHIRHPRHRALCPIGQYALSSRNVTATRQPNSPVGLRRGRAKDVKEALS